MREETVTYKVYKFSELDPKVQAKVIDNNRDWNVSDSFWYESVLEGLYDELKEKGFLDCKIYFSGFCSQGDGACFDCNSFDLLKLLNSLEDSSNFKKYKKYLTKLIDAGYISVGITTNNHHYSHERTRHISLDTNVYDKRCPKLYALIESFSEELEEIRLDLCRRIYKSLNEEYDYLTSDEAVKESIEANGLEFLENGNPY